MGHPQRRSNALQVLRPVYRVSGREKAIPEDIARGGDEPRRYKTCKHKSRSGHQPIGDWIYLNLNNQTKVAAQK